ncbi:hypothetical protein EW146_g3027 [Bondarzewia mesenterica]|uniref:BAG domain-containing protein n=1 Tax=Bondarzewia mesenterica TaxID=1095465 RepID=A0A4S4LYW2_9AGAM|nr:hypothetical protein EW146_g3027 [Bondarzewia mesenterica]
MQLRIEHVVRALLRNLTGEDVDEEENKQQLQELDELFVSNAKSIKEMRAVVTSLCNPAFPLDAEFKEKPGLGIEPGRTPNAITRRRTHLPSPAPLASFKRSRSAQIPHVQPIFSSIQRYHSAPSHPRNYKDVDSRDTPTPSPAHSPQPRPHHALVTRLTSGFRLHRVLNSPDHSSFRRSRSLASDYDRSKRDHSDISKVMASSLDRSLSAPPRSHRAVVSGSLHPGQNFHLQTHLCSPIDFPAHIIWPVELAQNDGISKKPNLSSEPPQAFRILSQLNAHFEMLKSTFSIPPKVDVGDTELYPLRRVRIFKGSDPLEAVRLPYTARNAPIHKYFEDLRATLGKVGLVECVDDTAAHDLKKSVMKNIVQEIEGVKYWVEQLCMVVE